MPVSPVSRLGSRPRTETFAPGSNFLIDNPHMAQSGSPLQEQTEADMNKRWSLLGMELKKLATSWRSNEATNSPQGSPKHEKKPGSPTQVSKSNRRSFGKVIPSFNRVKTFKRQRSELRDRLEVAPPSQDERRAISADRRTDTSRRRRTSQPRCQGPRASAPAFQSDICPQDSVPPPPADLLSPPDSPVEESLQFDTFKKSLSPDQPVPSFTLTDDNIESAAVADVRSDIQEVLISRLEEQQEETTELEHCAQEYPQKQESNPPIPTNISHQDNEHEEAQLRPYWAPDDQPELQDENSLQGYDEQQQLSDDVESSYAPSITDSQYDSLIQKELERKWILNLSMHFRDKSKREKFFVTYHQQTQTISAWRRVTISLDYRDAPENSLEFDLLYTKYQRDKSAKIYEAIRESLPDIQFYPTVTNLKLQTTDGRLHVHVVEDAGEIINYPSERMVAHLGCRRVREGEIEFDSHMSGFVYKVKVNGQILIKKEIPGPDTVDEFLYEVNALNRLQGSPNVIDFYGVVVDDYDDKVKGLLISYADQGALIDIIYDHDHNLEWRRRQKWARQIVQGLSDIHDAGFVQGDFTLSNIVIDDNDDAKIIDINRRGCPVGWEPPEATPLVESGQRISMYIGVKSDLFQLGMVLWALATQEDEPESHQRPLHLTADDAPRWYCRMVEICLSDDPRYRMHAASLLTLFRECSEDEPKHQRRRPASYSVSRDDYSVQSFPNNQAYRYVDVVNAADAETVNPPDCSLVSPLGYTGLNGSLHGLHYDNGYKPMRGRSPPRDLGFQPHGVTPRYSWQDNNVATGWESKSTTPRTGLSPHRDDHKLNEVQPRIRLEDVDTIPSVEDESLVTPVVPVVPTPKNVSGNTNAEQHANAGEPEAASKPSVDPDSKQEAHIPVAGRARHVPNTQPLEPDGVKGADDVEGEAKKATVDVKETQYAPYETASPQRTVEPAETQVDADMTTGIGDKGTSRDNEDQAEKQDAGITVPNIRVETADSQGKDSGVDTSNVMNDTGLAIENTANPRISSKDHESSNARAITDGIPSPKPPASPSPAREPTIQGAVSSSDPMLLTGICGNVDPVMNEKRRSGLFDDLDAIVSSEVIHSQEPTRTPTRSQGTMAVEGA